MTRYFSRTWQETLLEVFAPIAFVTILLTWFFLLISGFALMLLSMHHSINPPITDFFEACYFAGTSVLTLGFGDVVAAKLPARIVVLAAAMLGLIFMALEVSYLFVLQTCLQQREQVVNTLTSRAGSPASGLVLLLRYKELNLVPSLSGSYIQWETWVASILETHAAYPLLLYFRSSNRNNSWVSSIGAMLDAATLLSSVIVDVNIGEAELFYWLAIHTLKSISNYLDITPDDGEHMHKDQFLEGLQLLQDAGYKTKEPDMAWRYFRMKRQGYMRYLVPITRLFVAPIHIWLHKMPLAHQPMLDAVAKAPTAAPAD